MEGTKDEERNEMTRGIQTLSKINVYMEKCLYLFIFDIHCREYNSDNNNK